MKEGGRVGRDRPGCAPPAVARSVVIWSALALCAGMLGPVLVAGTAAAAPNGGARVALGGELPKVPSDVSRLGAVPGSRVLHLQVSLVGQDPTGLTQEVAAVSTPGSPLYHHYLTAAQFAASYGPSTAEVNRQPRVP